MKILPALLILLLIISCKTKPKTPTQKEDNGKKTEQTKPQAKTDTQNPENRNGRKESEVMKEEDIHFNGKLRRYFSLKEFETVFGKADSVKLMVDESPCSYIFENEDGTKDLNDKYVYKDGSRFEITKERVAVDEFRFSKGNFILFKGKKLSGSTTFNELKKIFPNAIENSGILKVYREDKLQDFQLREDENYVSDGHIKMYIKNGKLFSMWWWFPC